MLLRIFIVTVTALLIFLETIFLPCEFVNKGLPIQPDAGYHTFSNINTEMGLDMHALIYEACITLLLSATALTIAQATAKCRARSIMPRTWRTINP